jgi:tRNA threonylcarbamoyladenosine biosynthesis protein TsaE
MDIRYTQESVGEVATVLLTTHTPEPHTATIIGLSGDLGAGKTTLVQTIANALGVVETVTSPTFVVAKWYETNVETWKTLVHIDAYRIEDESELIAIGWEDIITSPETLVVIEWPEHIEQSLPPQTSRYMISHTGDSRHITTL